MRDDIHCASGGLACRASEEHTAVARRDMHRVVEADWREKAVVGGCKQSLPECVGLVYCQIWTNVFDRERLP